MIVVYRQRRGFLLSLGNLKVSQRTRRKSIRSIKTRTGRRTKSIRSINIAIKIEVKIKTRTRKRRKIKVAIMILVLIIQRSITRRLYIIVLFVLLLFLKCLNMFPLKEKCLLLFFFDRTKCLLWISPLSWIVF